MFFEEPGRLRLETIVHLAAAARLRDDFGWPREHFIFESPEVVDGLSRLLHQDALDILLFAGAALAPELEDVADCKPAHRCR